MTHPPPPYEYEEEMMPIDMLWGSDALRLQLEAAVPPGEILRQAAADAGDFAALVGPYLLYG